MKGQGHLALMALIVASAALVFLAGVRMAREETVVRHEQDRASLEAAGAELLGEVSRLERLYESHLRRFARELPERDEFGVRGQLKVLAGARQFSLIHPRSSRAKDWHVDIRPEATGQPPLPTFDDEDEAPWPGQEMVLLDEAAVSSLFGDDTGFNDEPGRPLFFWAHRDKETTAVILIDRPKVAASVHGSITNWWATNTAFPPEAMVRLRNPSAPDADATEGPPHFLLPVRSRYGAWQIAAWDRFETTTSYAMPVLAGAAVLSLLLLGGGLFAVSRQRAALRRAEQRVSFVNQVSHELRTPLTNIILNSDLAAEAAAAPERRRRLDLVRDEARRLSRMIGNVLTFAQRERGPLELRPVHCVPDGIVREVLEQFDTALERQSIRVTTTFAAADPVRLDPDALSQVVANLVSNVEKYAAGGDYLELVTRLDHASEQLEIEVRDHGPGIPAGATERIFRPFQRLGSSIREGVTGAGLGLAIARELTERMGGSIDCLEAEKGAAFRVTVPAPAEPANIVTIEESERQQAG